MASSRYWALCWFVSVINRCWFDDILYSADWILLLASVTRDLSSNGSSAVLTSTMTHLLTFYRVVECRKVVVIEQFWFSFDILRCKYAKMRFTSSRPVCKYEMSSLILPDMLCLTTSQYDNLDRNCGWWIWLLFPLYTHQSPRHCNTLKSKSSSHWHRWCTFFPRTVDERWSHPDTQ